jgi:Dolichyl-phosphate-mannose-protein mannosyltransferase
LPLEKLFAAAKDRPRLWLAALACLFAAQISPWLYPSVDGCLYLKTVSDFLSARRLDEFCCLVPPGYPVLIAPAFVFGDRPFLAVSILQWVLAVALIGGVYVWARRLRPSAALLLTTAVAVNISVWTFYRRPTKEIATLAALTWTVNAMHRLLDERRTGRVIGFTVFVGFFTAYLVLIRYAAIMLAVAFAMAVGWQARRGMLRPARAAVISTFVLILSGSTLVGWLAYDRAHGTHGTYVQAIIGIYRGHSLAEPGSQGADAAAEAEDPDTIEPRPERHFTRAVRYRMNDLACLTVPGFWKAGLGPGERLNFSTVVGGLVLGVVAVGWWRIVGLQIDLFAWLLPLYLVLYAHWDCAQPGGRFLLPMLPIILASFGWGLVAIAEFIAPLVTASLGAAPLVTAPPDARRWPAALLAVYLLTHLGQAAGYWLLIDAPRAYACRQNLPAMDRLAHRIHEHPGFVAVDPGLEVSCNGLWLDLDWKRLHLLQQPIQRRVEWIVQSRGGEPVAGFSLDSVDGPAQLLRRKPAEGSPSDRIGRQEANPAGRRL